MEVVFLDPSFIIGAKLNLSVSHGYRYSITQHIRKCGCVLRVFLALRFGSSCVCLCLVGSERVDLLTSDKLDGVVEVGAIRSHAGLVGEALIERGLEVRIVGTLPPASIDLIAEVRLVLGDCFGSRELRVLGELVESALELAELVGVDLLAAQGGAQWTKIAAQQSVSINTVQGRYRYALDKLRSMLNGEVEK